MPRIPPFIFAALVWPLLLSGCASLGETSAGWVGRVKAPDSVAGLDYPSIKELGALRGECAELAEARRRGAYVSRHWLNETALPGCQRRIDVAQALRRERQLDALVDQAYRDQQAIAAQRARAAAERRRIQEDMENQRREAQARSRAADRQALTVLRERLDDANIRGLLTDVPDQPLAYAVGQPSQRSMKDFLSCLEVGYPNQGYRIERDDGRLSVTALGANMLRGDVDIRARFVNVWDTWLLESLTVAEMNATTPQDRFLLAQNLLAGHCYGIDDLL
ncbi:hypothetical protein CEK62_04725 [Alcanivorax sp. N3-2A]|nr:hypothetical protein CEK62_04725 [Alcanivorax sp. N3-2A]|tara:strand:- start:290 stop:1123 length:834 start_codon:yes stop_codon:yes gene_type:complete